MPIPLRLVQAHEFALLPALARERKDENEQFIKAIRRVASRDFDQHAIPIAQQVAKAIDCTQCGNCCRHLEPAVIETELPILAQHAGLDTMSFCEQYTRIEPETNIRFLWKKPCMFLRGNLCTIYADRPLSCRDFPHLQGPNLKFRLRRLLRNYSICPIVFNTVELWKRHWLPTAHAQK